MAGSRVQDQAGRLAVGESRQHCVLDQEERGHVVLFKHDLRQLFSPVFLQDQEMYHKFRANSFTTCLPFVKRVYFSTACFQISGLVWQPLLSH